MPLVVLCGLPGSGKSAVASQVLQELSQVAPGSRVACVPDPTPPPGKLSCYTDSHLEKSTRAQIKSRVERELSAATTVVCDSLNYIKGFRYELYCLARSLGTQHCVIWCNEPEDDCLKRAELSGKYEPGVVAGLIKRFEAPIGTNRWDSPLFVTGNASPPESKHTAFSASDVVAVLLSGKKLNPLQATKKPTAAKVNLLHELDRATLEVDAILSDRIADAYDGDEIPVPAGRTRVVLTRVPLLSELKKTRREYMKLNQLNPPVIQDYSSLVAGYVDYWNARLRS